MVLWGCAKTKTRCSKQTKSALLKLVHEEEQEEEEEEKEEMGAGGNAAGGGAGRADSNQPAVSRFVQISQFTAHLTHNSGLSMRS